MTSESALYRLRLWDSRRSTRGRSIRQRSSPEIVRPRLLRSLGMSIVEKRDADKVIMKRLE